MHRREMVVGIPVADERAHLVHPILVVAAPGAVVARWLGAGRLELTPEQQFVDSPADCMATAGGWIDQDDPKTYDIKRPVFMDLDHVARGAASGAVGAP